MTTSTITTNDGVELAYIEHGSGRPVVLIHGWQQGAELWRHQLDDVSRYARAIAYDQRGHGESAKPAHGYKVHRLAKDLQDLLAALDLDDAVLVAHSMGCQVVLSYLELFGSERVGKVVLVDEPIFLTVNPAWDDRTIAETGALFPAEVVFETVNGLADPDSRETVVRGLINALTSPNMDAETKEWIVQRNLLMPGVLSAALFYNHAHQDWREQFRRIDVPALVVGAHGSIVNTEAMEWAASVIPDARLELFGADEGGSHFMFIENPTKFNAMLEAFIG